MPDKDADARSPLFRKEALAFHLEAEDQTGVVRISPPWIWSLFVSTVLLTATAFAVAIFVDVDVVARGAGSVQPRGGTRTISCQVSGTISAIYEHSGDRIKKGAPLLSVEAAALKSQTIQSEAQLAEATHQLPELRSKRLLTYIEQKRDLAARKTLLEEQIISQRSTLQTFNHKADIAGTLLSQGVVSQEALGAAKEGVAEQQRQLSVLLESNAQLDQEATTLEGTKDGELAQMSKTIDEAKTQRTALRTLEKQTILSAPVDGSVEALLVKVGDNIQAGEILAELIPSEAPLEVLAFIPEKDRATIKSGDAVKLEMAALPYTEYGALTGVITRIGNDLASPAQIERVLGVDAKIPSSYQVEIVITDVSPLNRMKTALRSGMQLNVRFTLRRQRLITFVFPPLRRWLH